MTTSTVSVGMIGTSWWADAMYLPALASHPSVQLQAICGRTEQKAQAMAQRWNIAQVFTDYETMLEQANLDAVVIATPNDTHYAMATQALEHGLHVLCEKPLALSYAHAAQMRDLAQAQGVVHMVPFTYRFMPTARYLKELMDSGYIGTPYHLNMRYYTGFARETNYQWRFDVEKAGSGVLGDIASHFLYLADWFFGEIKTVTCQLGHIVERPPTRPNGEPYTVGDDVTMLIVEFASGAYGVIHATAVCYEDTPFGQTHHMEFHGSGGTLYTYTDWDTVQQVKGARVGEGMLHELPIPDHIWGQARRDTVHNTYRDIFRQEGFMIQGFIDGIVNGEQVSPSFEDGARIQQVIEAALLSHQRGERVTVASIGSD